MRDNEQLKIELPGQWKLEAESRKCEGSVGIHPKKGKVKGTGYSGRGEMGSGYTVRLTLSGCLVPPGWKVTLRERTSV